MLERNRVLDLPHFLAAPYAALARGDLGADWFRPRRSISRAPVRTTTDLTNCSRLAL